jgi:hypothetical protein
MAALAAALTKREGLLFAAAAAALFVAFHPRFRAKRWLPRLASPLILAPAAAHALWTRAVGIKDTHAGATLPAGWRDLSVRLRAVGTGIMGFERTEVPLALGTAALLTYVLLELIGYRSWLARILAGTGLAVIAFSVLAMLISPYDVAWQVSTALDRMLGHAALCFFAAVIAALAQPQSSLASEHE